MPHQTKKRLKQKYRTLYRRQIYYYSLELSRSESIKRIVMAETTAGSLN